MSSVILVCAATSVEARACRKGVDQARASARYEILQTGMGLEKARAALENRLLDSGRPRVSLVISTGFAGSWTRSLSAGAWISGASIESHLAEQRFDLGLGLNSFSASLARVISISQACSEGEAGVFVDSDLPIAVDLESSSLAEVCRDRGIPFQILRLISDSPDAPLPRCIGCFASVFTAPSAREKFRSLLQGLSLVIAEPLSLARFIARGTKLPSLLSQGWKEIASQ